MKVSAPVVAAACLLASTSSVPGVGAWTSAPHHRLSSRLSRTRAAASLQEGLNDELFDWAAVLTEGGGESTSSAATASSSFSRRRVALPSQNERTTILASAFPAPSEALEESSTTDPYSNAFDSQLEKINSYTEQKPQSFEDRLKTMDFQDIVMTLVIPSIALFAGGRWVYNRAAGRVMENTDITLDAFAKEMLYHDGDFDEMKLCYTSYSTKLTWLGPKKREAMMQRFLQAYAKKMTITPKAIASLSQVFTIAKLSEPAAANLIVNLCRKMGGEKISSAGKLLFLGSRILKSPEGIEALLPIKEMIKGTYRDASVADTLVETSQQAIAEASYRATIHSYGKKQTTLSPGWETLGLDKETADRIFQEEAKEGFLSQREVMYGQQSQRYNKKGQVVDREGKLVDPSLADEEEEEDDSPAGSSVSNAFECSQCGFTLFVAQGRESKFFGTGFTCPECGAPKSKFEAKEDFGE